MSTLIIGHGPAGSGKSVAAREWWGEGRNGLLIEEGDFGARNLKLVNNSLDQGRDVWMNLRNDIRQIGLNLGPHTVIVYPFPESQ
jgi:hypothetical protein